MEENEKITNIEKARDIEMPKSRTYPLEEEMIFKSTIKSEDEGYALLRAVQILVNELGTHNLIQVVNAIQRNPNLLHIIKSYIPYVI